MSEGNNSGYYKPVLSGAICDNEILCPGDCEYVINFAGLNQVPLKALTYVFEEAVSPHLAARNSGVKIDKNKIINDFKTFSQEYLLVEGAGGITCPLEIDNEIYLMSDLIKDLGLGVVIVADAGLGVINSVLLTLEYAKSKGIKVKGVILNKFIPENLMYLDNLITIEKLSGVPVLGTVGTNSQKVEWRNSTPISLFA